MSRRGGGRRRIVFCYHKGNIAVKEKEVCPTYFWKKETAEGAGEKLSVVLPQGHRPNPNAPQGEAFQGFVGVFLQTFH